MISERLKLLREEKNLNRKQIADQLNLPYTTYINYESGAREPGSETLIQISKYYGTSIDYIFGLSKLRNAANISQAKYLSDDIIEKYEKLDERGRNIVNSVIHCEYQYCAQSKPHPAPIISPKESRVQKDYIEMKIFNEPAAAGFGNYLSDDDNNYEVMPFPASEVPRNAAIGVRIAGDSMEPTIRNGSIAWVESYNGAQSSDIKNGEIGIFIVNGDAYCKRLFKSESTQCIELKSDNKKYKPIIIENSEELWIMGKVLSATN